MAQLCCKLSSRRARSRRGTSRRWRVWSGCRPGVPVAFSWSPPPATLRPLRARIPPSPPPATLHTSVEDDFNPPLPHQRFRKRHRLTSGAGNIYSNQEETQLSPALKKRTVTQEGSRPASAEQRLKELGIELPAPPEPFGTYVEAVQTGSLLVLSGMLPTEGRTARFIGRVGAELDVEAGRKAAHLAALNALAVARKHLGCSME